MCSPCVHACYVIITVVVVTVVQSTDTKYVRCSPVDFLEVERTTAFTRVFADKETEDKPDFFSLANFLLFFFLVALASCREMGVCNNE